MLVKAYGGNALSRAQFYRLFEKLQNGDFDASVKTITPKCLANPPVDRERLNAHLCAKVLLRFTVHLEVPFIWECYVSSYGKCEEYFEKLSDSQERLPVTESPQSRCIQLHASEPLLQLGSDRLMFRWTLRWDRKLVEILISLYKKYPVLYEKKTDGYYDRKQREIALLSIAAEMSKIRPVTIDDVKKKIKTLRSQFSVENVHRYRSLTSGTGNKIFVPKLWCYHLLSFLDKYMQVKDLNCLDKDYSLQTSNNTVSKPLKERNNIISANTMKKSTKLKESMKNPSNRSEEDVHDAFGKYVASELRAIHEEELLLDTKLAIQVWSNDYDCMGPLIHVEEHLNAQRDSSITTYQVHSFIKMKCSSKDRYIHQDNASCYTGTIVPIWFKKQDRNYTFFGWPTQSPDLNN
ncbi:hypothetical protein TNCV_4813051 [Trichonephila clavipes]|nr:hypothetical protein TNCV_4813051 [Trichonephila clavipes]